MFSLCFAMIFHVFPFPTTPGRDEQAMMDKVEMPVLLMPAGNDPENLKEGRLGAGRMGKPWENLWENGKIIGKP